MNRRGALLASCVLALVSIGALAQPKSGAPWRVGFLAAGASAGGESENYAAFVRGMRELGYAEGKNLVIELRDAQGDYLRLPALAEELVRLKVDVIVGGGAPAIGAAKKATSTVPIVMGTAGDPVRAGFIASFARPGGNITGLSDMNSDIGAKQLDMLLSVVPKLRHVAVLLNPGNASHAGLLESVQASARKGGITVTPVRARSAQEIEGAFGAMGRDRSAALLVGADPFFNQQSQQIAGLAAKGRLPSVSGYWKYVDAGGLMHYGPVYARNFHRAASYVDRIFKGAKPADLPVEQASTLELAVNLRAAKALGLDIQQSFLARADRVIADGKAALQ